MKEPQLRLLYVLNAGEGPEPKSIGYPYGVTFPHPYDPKGELRDLHILERPDTPQNRERFRDLATNMSQVYFADLESQEKCRSAKGAWLASGLASEKPKVAKTKKESKEG